MCGNGITYPDRSLVDKKIYSGDLKELESPHVILLLGKRTIKLIKGQTDATTGLCDPSTYGHYIHKISLGR